ncbi:DUF5610 domain-containing protein [Oceanobacter kriegii]|uniref:DUF5610 domain-containing protein n=1 Tax=Oceanobacter kriegii TaxID=64972 RepID=UPI0003FE85F8|nr:DUF5610 domain-containing protein [Oceanobacter kriegii]
MIDFNNFVSGKGYQSSQTLGSSTANSTNARSAEAKAESGYGAGEVTESDSGSGIQLGERVDPETTANNILEFVSRGIDNLKAQGASEERIQARLEAAREGVAKGYAEATEMLDGMGLLSEDLESEIATSRSIVDSSLADLSSLENYLNQNNVDDVAESQQLTVSALMSSVSSASASGNSGAVQNSANYSRADSSNTFALEVQTRDGDTVTVYYEQNSSMEEASSNGSYAFSSLQDQAFSFSVEGELDDGEMEALNGLFKQVESLSNQFFAGNMGEAIKQAMDIGYDSTELAAFSLDLSQSRSVQTTNVYQQPGYSSAASSAPTEALESVKGPLANYVESVLASAEQAQPFGNALDMINTMAESLVGEDNDRFSAFQQFNQALVDLSNARSDLAESV